MSTSIAAPSETHCGGILFARDLMFISKITGTAAALGIRIEALSDVDELKRRIAVNAPRAVFLDLSCADLKPVAVVEVSSSDSGRPVFVAFGSHVDVKRLDEARSAGCHFVLPRSQFSATLPDLLKQLFGTSAPNADHD